MADDPTTPAAPDPADRIRELEAQVAKERQRAELVERTLSALGDRQPAAQPPPAQAGGPAPAPIHFSRDQITRIAQATGLPEETVQQYAPLIGAMFTEFATPLVREFGGAVNTLADYADRHDVEISDKDVYAKYKDEVETERKSRIGRGEAPGSRKELVQVVRARHLPELVAEEAKRKMDEDTARAAAAGAATTEPTTKQVARPSPTQAATPKSIEEISKIPDRNERIAALEAAAEGQTF